MKNNCSIVVSSSNAPAALLLMLRRHLVVHNTRRSFISRITTVRYNMIPIIILTCPNERNKVNEPGPVKNTAKMASKSPRIMKPLAAVSIYVITIFPPCTLQPDNSGVASMDAHCRDSAYRIFCLREYVRVTSGAIQPIRIFLHRCDS